MGSMARKTLARVVYIIIVVIPFFIGAFIVPNLSPLKDNLGMSESYSIVSGLSLATWLLLPALLIEWLKSRSINSVFIKKTLVSFAIFILLVCSVALYPPITTLFLSWESYKLFRPSIAVIYAGLTALSSFVVYILGQNGYSEIQNDERDGVIKFLLTVVTLVSLTSIAISFVLGNSVPSFYQRAIVLSSYCLLPLAAYSLGYLDKLMKLRVATGLGVFLSVILGFFIGIIVNSITLWNSFFFSVNVPLFLIIGLILAFFESG